MNSSLGPFFVIILGISLGAFLRRVKRFGSEAPRVLNAYVITVALPAVVLSQLPRFLHSLGTTQSPSSGPAPWILIILAVIPWVIFGLAILFFRLLYKAGKISKSEWGLLALSGGLGNTSFVGIPLLEALLGKGVIPQAILLDQLGTFLALGVAGTAWLAYMKETKTGSFHWGAFFKDLFQFPPFLALLVSFIYSYFGKFEGESEIALSFQSALERFASTLVPVAMISVGAQLKLEWNSIKKETKGLVFGLGYKMLLVPLVMFFVLNPILHSHPESFKVAILESAMAPMITATVLGIEAGLAPSLGALMLGVGIPLSLITVPIWAWVIN